MPKTEVMRQVTLNAHLRPMMSVMMPIEKAPMLHNWMISTAV
jgi:hypothetical protein